MAQATRTIRFRRKRERRTDYKKRLKYLLSGKPRAVVRKGSRDIIVQIIEYAPGGDLTRVLINSRVLAKYGWKYSYNSIPSAYLSGLLAGKTAMQKDIKELIVDFGLQNVVRGAKLFAALKGMVDSGVKIAVDEAVFPSEERVSGVHIAQYADKIKSDKNAYGKQFSAYLKNGSDPEKIADAFKTVKDKILKS